MMRRMSIVKADENKWAIRMGDGRMLPDVFSSAAEAKAKLDRMRRMQENRERMSARREMSDRRMMSGK